MTPIDWSGSYDTTIGKRRSGEMTIRDTIMEIAQKHDPDAEWASDALDENVLLIMPSATIFLLDRYYDAYEDPNPPGSIGTHTRLVFPSL